MVGDSAGNLYVAGSASKATITGYTTTTVKGKTTQTPIYSYVGHWLVRKSTNGGATWVLVDDDCLFPSQSAVLVSAMGEDLTGNVYVVGAAGPQSDEHAIVRSNAGGMWTTIDDYSGEKLARYTGFTTGADGTLYAAGRGGTGLASNFLIRSAPGPAPALAPASTLFSATTISDADLATDVIGA